MAEAQKMMQSPEFQAQMRKMSESAAFKQAMNQTKEMLQNPEQVKAMEAKMKAAVEAGTKELEAAKKEQSLSGENDTTDEKQGAEKESDELEVPNLNIN